MVKRALGFMAIKSKAKMIKQDLFFIDPYP